MSGLSTAGFGHDILTCSCGVVNQTREGHQESLESPHQETLFTHEDDRCAAAAYQSLVLISQNQKILVMSSNQLHGYVVLSQILDP